MSNPAVQFGRSLRPLQTAIKDVSQNQTQILFGKLSVEQWSANITVGPEPTVIKAFGLPSDKSITVFNVFNNYKEKMYFNGSDFVLDATNNVLILAIAGVYSLFTDAELGNFRCIAYPLSAMDKKAKVDNDMQNPNGPQNRKGNLYFDGSSGLEYSREFYVGSTPMAFRAYGVTDQVIQLLQVFDMFETEVIEESDPVEMDVDNTTLVITIAGKYKFKLVGDSETVVLVANPTNMDYSNPYLTRGEPGEPGPPGTVDNTATLINGGNF